MYLEAHLFGIREDATVEELTSTSPIESEAAALTWAEASAPDFWSDPEYATLAKMRLDVLRFIARPVGEMTVPVQAE